MCIGQTAGVQELTPCRTPKIRPIGSEMAYSAKEKLLKLFDIMSHFNVVNKKQDNCRGSEATKMSN